MRGSSSTSGGGAMLAATSAVPSAGQKPASFGYTRWHFGQLFNAPSLCSASSLRSLGHLRSRGGERYIIDDAVARWALLENGLASQPVKELGRQGHVARFAGAVGRLGDAGPALLPNH